MHHFHDFFANLEEQKRAVAEVTAAEESSTDDWTTP